MNNELPIPEAALKDEGALEIDVLGAKYSVAFANEKDEPRLSRVCGFCDDSVKKIVIDNNENHDLLDKEDLLQQQKKTVRHEIVHAFLCESGLADCSDWATNEEIVDWIALQGLKLYKAWQEAGAI